MRIQRTLFVLLIVVLMLGIVGIAAAQEATVAPDVEVIDVAEGETPPIVVEDGGTVVIEAPPPIVDTTERPLFLVVLAASVILIVLFAGSTLVLAKDAKDALPPWAKDLLLNNREYITGRLDSGLDAIDQIAWSTPSTLDDLLAKYGRERVEKWFNDFYAESPAAVNTLNAAIDKRVGEVLNKSYEPPEGSQPHR